MMVSGGGLRIFLIGDDISELPHIIIKFYPSKNILISNVWLGDLSGCVIIMFMTLRALVQISKMMS